MEITRRKLFDSYQEKHYSLFGKILICCFCITNSLLLSQMITTNRTELNQLDFFFFFEIIKRFLVFLFLKKLSNFLLYIIFLNVIGNKLISTSWIIGSKDVAWDNTCLRWLIIFFWVFEKFITTQTPFSCQKINITFMEINF